VELTAELWRCCGESWINCGECSANAFNHLRIDEAQQQNIIRIAEHLSQISTSAARAERFAAEIRVPERLAFSIESLSPGAKVSFSNGLQLFSDRTCQGVARGRECAQG
jgi:hypothetical protein